MAKKGLNPCSNGICSLTEKIIDAIVDALKSLNPCSNGICSLTTLRTIVPYGTMSVLILVLMEYAL